ncbi:5713_t:CDS:2, partial [Racocetra persica]
MVEAVILVEDMDSDFRLSFGRLKLWTVISVEVVGDNSVEVVDIISIEVVGDNSVEVVDIAVGDLVVDVEWLFLSFGRRFWLKLWMIKVVDSEIVGDDSVKVVAVEVVEDAVDGDFGFKLWVMISIETMILIEVMDGDFEQIAVGDFGFKLWTVILIEVISDEV